MKRKYIHHHKDIYWNILVFSMTKQSWGRGAVYDPDGEGVHITIKSNCPAYIGEFTCAISKAEAVSFLFWVESHPIHQLPLLVRSMLVGHRPGLGWDSHVATGKMIYEAMTKQHRHMEVG